MKQKINLSMIIIGLVGMITIVFMVFNDSQATDIASAIPIQILFAALFISGYLKYKDK